MPTVCLLVRTLGPPSSTSSKSQSFLATHAAANDVYNAFNLQPHLISWSTLRVFRTRRLRRGRLQLPQREDRPLKDERTLRRLT